MLDFLEFDTLNECCDSMNGYDQISLAQQMHLHRLPIIDPEATTPWTCRSRLVPRCWVHPEIGGEFGCEFWANSWEFKMFTPLISPRWVFTPQKFNIALKNRQSQKETHLPTIIFQGLCPNFGGVSTTPKSKVVTQEISGLPWKCLYEMNCLTPQYPQQNDRVVVSIWLFCSDVYHLFNRSHSKKLWVCTMCFNKALCKVLFATSWLVQFVANHVVNSLTNPWKSKTIKEIVPWNCWWKIPTKTMVFSKGLLI